MNTHAFGIWERIKSWVRALNRALAVPQPPAGGVETRSDDTVFQPRDC